MSGRGRDAEREGIVTMSAVLAMRIPILRPKNYVSPLAPAPIGAPRLTSI